jgi:hypothetical protein
MALLKGLNYLKLNIKIISHNKLMENFEKVAVFNLMSLPSGLRETLTTYIGRHKTLRMQFQSITLPQTTYFMDINSLFFAIYVKCLRRGPVQNPSFKGK